MYVCLICVYIPGTNKSANCRFECHRKLVQGKKQVQSMVNNGFILSGAVVVRALRDIAPGEEILVRYPLLEQPEIQNTTQTP
jgi:hypothetical protein